METYGYSGKILYVDLNTGEIKTKDIDPDMAKRFIGGIGINMRLAYDLLKHGIDPLSPDNIIVIGAGPFVGTRLLSTPRCSILTKYPLTGAVAYANCGMGFSRRLKYAGYDHVVITGQAEKPVYLKVSDDETGELGYEVFLGTDFKVSPRGKIYTEVGYSVLRRLNKDPFAGLHFIAGWRYDLVQVYEVSLVDSDAPVTKIVVDDVVAEGEGRKEIKKDPRYVASIEKKLDEVLNKIMELEDRLEHTKGTAEVAKAEIYKDPQVYKGKLEENLGKGVIYHYVASGDTLTHISVRYFEVPWVYDEIAKMNNIEDPNLILVGTYIKIDKNLKNKSTQPQVK